MDVVVQLSDIALVRDGTSIVHDVDWTVRAGQRWIVLGPNGSGKSTILRIASTDPRPTRGTVEVLGERYGRTDVPALRRRIGYTSAGLERLMHGRLTARTAVATGRHAVLRTFRETYTDADWARTDELLARLGVAHRADHPLDLLSEGERRRVQLGRVLMADPEVLLLDEPTAGLDLAGREQLVALLADLAADRDGVRAIAFVTHHVDEIPPGFTHLAMVVDGTVRHAGPIEEALTSATLTDAFGVPLELRRDGDRWTSRLAR